MFIPLEPQNTVALLKLNTEGVVLNTVLHIYITKLIHLMMMMTVLSVPT